MGTLYRACWISKQEYEIASKAKNLRLTTSSKSLQSWTDSFETAKDLHHEVVTSPRSKKFVDCVVEAIIPGKDILVSLHELEKIFQKYSKAYDKQYESMSEEQKDRMDYYNAFEDALLEMSEYYDEREWIVNLEEPVKINSIKVPIMNDDWYSVDEIKWKDYNKAGALDDGEVTLVLDPDTGILS